ncbi:hypothetical protein HDV00_012795 [Rhizophlyctis rosea]|nr:hypothetical protein HDV00_012795 [Rhizophlyctis rosea]
MSSPFYTDFRRLIDSRILRDNSAKVGLACLEVGLQQPFSLYYLDTYSVLPIHISRTTTKTLHTLLSNILTNPTTQKYRSFRARNPHISNTLLKLLGGSDTLPLLGFVKSVKEFEEFWVLPDTVDFEIVRMGLRIVDEYLEKAKAKTEREDKKSREMKIAGSEEKQRREKALQLIEEDRKQVKERAAREMLRPNPYSEKKPATTAHGAEEDDE